VQIYQHHDADLASRKAACTGSAACRAPCAKTASACMRNSSRPWTPRPTHALRDPHPPAGRRRPHDPPALFIPPAERYGLMPPSTVGVQAPARRAWRPLAQDRETGRGIQHQPVRPTLTDSVFLDYVVTELGSVSFPSTAVLRDHRNGCHRQARVGKHFIARSSGWAAASPSTTSVPVSAHTPT